MFELVIDTKALDFLTKVEESIAKRIWEKIQKAKVEPNHYFERLTSRQEYKIRVGDYRVIADIDFQNKLIKVTLIGHRKNIYKK